MLLGALIDAGVPLADVRRALGTLAIDSDTVWTERVNRAGIMATKFQVRGEATLLDHAHDEEHRHDHRAAHEHVHAGEVRAHAHSRSHAHPHSHQHADDAGHTQTHVHAPAVEARHHHGHRTLREI